MKTIIEFCAIFLLGILSPLMGALFVIKRPDYKPFFTTSENLLREWGSSLSMIVVVLLVAINQPDGVASIGILTGVNAAGKNLGAMIIGILILFCLILASYAILRLIQFFRRKSLQTQINTANPAVINTMQYRDGLERTAHLSVLIFAVISEDLVYRGYLVLMLGSKTGTFIPWIILSIALSVVIHLYQGRSVRIILSQGIFAAFCIGITIITKNILAPITAHLYYDIMWTFQVWKQSKKMEGGKELNPGSHKKLAYSIFIGGNLILLIYFGLQLIS